VEGSPDSHGASISEWKSMSEWYVQGTSKVPHQELHQELQQKVCARHIKSSPSRAACVKSCSKRYVQGTSKVLHQELRQELQQKVCARHIKSSPSRAACVKSCSKDYEQGTWLVNTIREGVLRPTMGLKRGLNQTHGSAHGRFPPSGFWVSIVPSFLYMPRT